MSLLRQYGGQALTFVGALLLIACRLAGWQSNTELCIGLILILSGYFLYLWLKKHGEKY